MTKKQIYICLLIAFISISFLALYFESFWAGIGATLLLIILIDDKEWYLNKEKKYIPLEKYKEDKRIGEFVEVSKNSIKRIKEINTGEIQVTSKNIKEIWNDNKINIEKRLEQTKKIKLAVTNHAKKRIVSRLNCKPDKYRKIIKKAWKSENVMSEDLQIKVFNSKYATPDSVYKYYLGYVFIFKDTTENEKRTMLLITLYDPKVYN